MIKVSVIMPIYNAEKYLVYALESLIHQTLKDIEIICVDDGSTDRTSEILKEYQNRDDRITVLRQNNKFAGVARNKGMSIAKGKYLSFLDADDYFHEEMLEKAYRCAEEENADVVVFGGKYFRNTIEDAYAYPSLLKEDLIPNSKSFTRNENPDGILIFTTPAPWNKIFRTEFIQSHQLQFQPYKRVNDAYFVELAIALANRIGIVRENLIYYRTGNEGSLQGGNNQTPTHFATVFLDIKEKLVEKGLFDELEKSYRNICLSNCIYTLESLTNGEAYEALYMELKTVLFQKFNITGSDKEDYYNKYAFDQYVKISSMSPTGYLLQKYRNLNGVYNQKQYLFPFHKIERDSNVILYAAGKVGDAFQQQIKKTNYCNLIAWVDKNAKCNSIYKISNPKEVDWDECDYIVIAIEHERIAFEIKEELMQKYRVTEEKIIWEHPVI